MSTLQEPVLSADPAALARGPRAGAGAVQWRRVELAADGWSVLRHAHPGDAERLNGVLHYLARLPGNDTAKETDMTAEDRPLDVRSEAPARRHTLIFETWTALGDGEGFVLVNDHDPKPLYYQFAAEHEGRSPGTTWSRGRRRGGSASAARPPPSTERAARSPGRPSAAQVRPARPGTPSRRACGRRRGTYAGDRSPRKSAPRRPAGRGSAPPWVVPVQHGEQLVAEGRITSGPVSLATSASSWSIARHSSPCSRSMTKTGAIRPASRSGGNRNSSSR